MCVYDMPSYADVVCMMNYNHKCPVQQIITTIQLQSMRVSEFLLIRAACGRFHSKKRSVMVAPLQHSGLWEQNCLFRHARLPRISAFFEIFEVNLVIRPDRRRK